MGLGRRRLRLIRAHAARIGFLVATMIFLVGMARSGARYFFCAAMNATLMDESCCGPAAHDDDELDLDVGRADPGVEAPECCNARRLGSLPSATTAAAPEIGDVPITAELPPFDALAIAPEPRQGGTRAYFARARPPPSARERRATMMTWTC